MEVIRALSSALQWSDTKSSRNGVCCHQWFSWMWMPETPCYSPCQTLITLVLVFESKPSCLKESWFHPTISSIPIQQKRKRQKNLNLLIIFELKVKTRKGVIICSWNQISQPKVLNSQVDAMCTPNEESICYKMNCGKALGASQYPMTRPLCPFKHVIKTWEKLHFAPDIKAPLKDCEYNLKARQFWRWQESWTHPITFGGTGNIKKKKKKKNKALFKEQKSLRIKEEKCKCMWNHSLK